MLKKLSVIVFVLSTVFSCTIQKRTFNKGFYVSWNKSYRGKESTRIDEKGKESTLANTEVCLFDSTHNKSGIDTPDLPHPSLAEISFIPSAGNQFSKPSVSAVKSDQHQSYSQVLKKRELPPRIGSDISFGLPTDFYAIMAYVGFILFILALILLTSSVDALLAFLLVIFGACLSIGSTITGLTRLNQGDWGDFVFTRFSIIAFAIFWSIFILVGIILLAAG